LETAKIIYDKVKEGSSDMEPAAPQQKKIQPTDAQDSKGGGCCG
jgi:hypothetical protein